MGSKSLPISFTSLKGNRLALLAALNWI